MQKLELKNQLRKWFEQSGLICLGVVDLNITRDISRFKEWLSEGLHADMNFLLNHIEIRENPEKILKDAKSAIIFGYHYGNAKDSSNSEVGKIAQYARLRDYHKFMRERAELITNKISQIESFKNETFRIAIDSAPVLERAFARKTSKGFIGKNTCFIHPELGSFLLLGEIFTTIDFEIDLPANVDPNERSKEGGCGTCKRCQVYCPTGALDEDYKLNAKKCISYWTIEHRGPIPVEMWPALTKYVFGCDICQNVCPYNRDVPQNSHTNLDRLNGNVDLYSLAVMTQQEYIDQYGGTPMTRAKRHGLRRNALIAMFQNNDPKLQGAIRFAQTDPHPDLTTTIAQIVELQSLNGNAFQ